MKTNKVFSWKFQHKVRKLNRCHEFLYEVSKCLFFEILRRNLLFLSIHSIINDNRDHTANSKLKKGAILIVTGHDILHYLWPVGLSERFS